MELKKEYEFFQSKLNDLIKEAPNKFVIIKDQKILKIVDSEEEVLKFSKEQNLESGTFLAQKIENVKHYISRLQPINSDL